MKDQYFADQHDFLKYDLAVFLANQLQLRRLSIVWMLTQNDGSTDGKQVEYRQGAGRPDLYRFLQEKLQEDQREVSKLQEYFDGKKFLFQYRPYGDDLSRQFTNGNREDYFRRIPDKDLQQAVILTDADNGLVVPSAGPKTLHKYIKFEEVQDLYDRMDRESIITIYQHLPHQHRKAFLYSTAAKLKDLLNCPLPCSVSDGLVAFIMIIKTKERQKELKEVLADYLRTHLTLYD